ncbi:MAG: DDE transposase family protein [Synechococcales cyanobacterium RU_4_20]|nr:DDE transposase family protein [Synechococcales cyanobacterium RU_4_20]NJR68433.1 DDE transposase family protein [Synechococcales cyanobacterium CRU_2_2]
MIQSDKIHPDPVRFSNLWYVVAEAEGHCRVLTAQQLASHADLEDEEEMPTLECWGPFSSQGEAIAKCADLIRSGKCKANLQR